MFRPFLVLRGKLRSPAPQAGAESSDKLRELTWLDTACEYCLEPARQIIKYINKSCEINPLCKVCAKACRKMDFDLHYSNRIRNTFPSSLKAPATSLDSTCSRTKPK